MARKGRSKLVNPDDLSPGLAAGLTQGASAKEALEQFPDKPILTPAQKFGHMRDAATMGRVPAPRFVAEENSTSVMVEEATGRVMNDVTITPSLATERAIKAGAICLRCLEPQETSFPQVCDLCGYPMKERQILDVAMEFEGERHIGPSKPISEYIEEKDELSERRAHNQALKTHRRTGGGVLIP